MFFSKGLIGWVGLLVLAWLVYGLFLELFREVAKTGRKKDLAVLFAVFFIVFAGGVWQYRVGAEEYNQTVLRKNYQIHLSTLVSAMNRMYKKNGNHFDWIYDGENDIENSMSEENKRLLSKEFDSWYEGHNFNVVADGKKVKLRKDAAGIILFIADDSGGIYEPQVEEYAPWSGSLVRKIL